MGVAIGAAVAEDPGWLVAPPFASGCPGAGCVQAAVTHIMHTQIRSEQCRDGFIPTPSLHSKTAAHRRRSESLPEIGEKGKRDYAAEI